MQNKNQLRILIVGAGVIGSLCGYRFAKAGYNVTFLARGERLKQLQVSGLELYNRNKKKSERLEKFSIIKELAADDVYDYVFICLRRDNLPSIYLVLAGNQSHCFVFMANNPYGSREYEQYVPLDKVLMAFPGAAGDMNADGVVNYTIVNHILQPTTLGAVADNQQDKVRAVKTMLKDAQFPVAGCKDMDAWMLTHAALICPLTNAIYYQQGTSIDAAKSKVTMLYTAQALKEAFWFLYKSKTYRIVPAKLKIFVYLPTLLLRFALSLAYRTPQVKAMMPDYTSHSPAEMQLLSKEFAAIAETEGFRMV